ISRFALPSPSGRSPAVDSKPFCSLRLELSSSGCESRSMPLLPCWIGVFLRPRPSTLHTHWPLEPLDGLPAVVHLFNRLQRAFPDAAGEILGAVGHAGGPNSRIAETLQPYGVESHLSTLGSQPQALAELCKRLSGRAQSLVLYPDHSIFPDCVLSRELLT